VTQEKGFWSTQFCVSGAASEGKLTFGLDKGNLFQIDPLFYYRVSHPSRFSSLCNLARKAARAANSAGMCKDAGFALSTRTGGSQAESSLPWASTILSISTSERLFPAVFLEVIKATQ
jgi:hypothetical protein